MFRTKQTEIDFFKSAMVRDTDEMPVKKILDWIALKNEEVHTRLERISLEKMRLWRFDDSTGNIVHDSGKFFSIEGIRVETNWGLVPVWEQPIINQPEIGFLGIMTKKINGILHFLMQAKTEPGNLNTVQISPTLQATKSNYSRVHKGKSPTFLEYFNGEKPVKILLDQLQSEQGARFLRKRNRNIIIEIPENEEIIIPDNFIWITLGQLKELIKFDNAVNMDTRSVISCIPFGSCSDNDLKNEDPVRSLLDSDFFLNDFDQIISWITNLKSSYDLNVTNIPLNKVNDWIYDGTSISHISKKYFSVIGVRVEIGNREVVSWDQPMILPTQDGIMAFIVKRINGVYHFLVQGKLEAGNFDILELAPTVQCLTGNYRTGQNEYSVPFLNNILEAKKEQIWYSAYQSEEGGRFFKEQNRNMIIEAGHDFPDEVPENYCWMTFQQLMTFIKFNNYLNIAARSLISAVSF
ncbi:MAG: NDP-hexose 2,3-dehydratase family protein [Bacteroidales bacterium]|nr:NDP-hexose 2,3-dehydratase family protein [Bacteroidales bacterium]